MGGNSTGHATGILYIIGTPIGNLGDITLRVLDLLRDGLDLLYCEDTRVTSKLLQKYEMSVPLKSYTEHNEKGRIPEIISLLQEGKKIGLASDAGMPVISDPGYKLVREVLQLGLPVEILPGATAAIPALIRSGFPPDSYYFGGFLPEKPGRRQKKLHSLKDLDATLIFYLSPWKVEKFLKDVLDVLGNREIAIVREITKIYEESIRMPVSDFLTQFAGKTWKGEIVLLIEGATGDHDPETE